MPTRHRLRGAFVSAVPGAVRLAPATLYASIFRFDDEVLANFLLFGNPAAASQLLRFRRRGETGTDRRRRLRSLDRAKDRGGRHECLPTLGQTASEGRHLVTSILW